MELLYVYVTSSGQTSAKNQDEITTPYIFFSMQALRSSIVVAIWVRVSFLRQQTLTGRNRNFPVALGP